MLFDCHVDTLTKRAKIEGIIKNRRNQKWRWDDILRMERHLQEFPIDHRKGPYSKNQKKRP